MQYLKISLLATWELLVSLHAPSSLSDLSNANEGDPGSDYWKLRHCLVSTAKTRKVDEY